MIDTHCHIYLPQFRDDFNAVCNRAIASGISDILMPAIDFESGAQMQSCQYDDLRFHPMAGLHPCEIKGAINQIKLESWAADPLSVAIGETGLDYYWSKEHIEDQKRSLRFHCALARNLGKPIVLHNRDSTTDLLDLIEEEQDGTLTGVWHCFTGTAEEGKRAIDLGLKLGIGGVVTFKNGGVDKSVAELPLSEMILETDSPYLAPVPHRGKRNEPAYTQLVGIKLSAIFGLPLSEIDRITTQTAQALFKLNDSGT